MFSKSDPLIECVPNFSEGRNQFIIDSIAEAIETVTDVKLMHVDAGFDANRTVYTFAGKPEAVLDAAFMAIQTARNLIDMTYTPRRTSAYGCVRCLPVDTIAKHQYG
jgi:glutamate formiminotransferase